MKRVSFSQNSFRRSNDCIIRNCDELTSIEFDDYSFHELSGVFELSDLKSIEKIAIGDNSLVNAMTVLAGGLKSLIRMSVGEGSLTNIQTYVISN